MAPSAASTDWEHILALCDQLVALHPSPVVELNRAVALGRVRGPYEGLQALEKMADHPALQQYYLLSATLAELWMEIGRLEQAAAYYRRAVALYQARTALHVEETAGMRSSFSGAPIMRDAVTLLYAGARLPTG